MCNEIIWFIEVELVAGKLKRPQENGLKLSH